MGFQDKLDAFLYDTSLSEILRTPAGKTAPSAGQGGQVGAKVYR